MIAIPQGLRVAFESAIPSVETMEGYDDIRRKFAESLTLEERLAGLSPEQRLAGLPPEQRLAGLAPEQVFGAFPPEQRLLSLPDEALRALSDDYLRSLPPDVQDAVRKRIGRPSP